MSPGQPTLQFARTANLQAIGPSEIVTAGLTTVGFTVNQGQNLLEVTHGHILSTTATRGTQGRMTTTP